LVQGVPASSSARQTFAAPSVTQRPEAQVVALQSSPSSAARTQRPPMHALR
jgi:hypothetical protein